MDFYVLLEIYLYRSKIGKVHHLLLEKFNNVEDF